VLLRSKDRSRIRVRSMWMRHILLEIVKLSIFPILKHPVL
jgi:hypothetical protein